jgi:hypothetical protein
MLIVYIIYCNTYTDLSFSEFNKFVLFQFLNISTHIIRGPGSSVGIATGYGLEGPRIEPGIRSSCKNFLNVRVIQDDVCR